MANFCNINTHNLWQSTGFFHGKFLQHQHSHLTAGHRVFPTANFCNINAHSQFVTGHRKEKNPWPISAISTNMVNSLQGAGFFHGQFLQHEQTQSIHHKHKFFPWPISATSTVNSSQVTGVFHGQLRQNTCTVKGLGFSNFCKIYSQFIQQHRDHQQNKSEKGAHFWYHSFTQIARVHFLLLATDTNLWSGGRVHSSNFLYNFMADKNS